jgi:hypothetical protein
MRIDFLKDVLSSITWSKDNQVVPSALFFRHVSCSPIFTAAELDTVRHVNSALDAAYQNLDGTGMCTLSLLLAGKHDTSFSTPKLDSSWNFVASTIISLDKTQLVAYSDNPIATTGHSLRGAVSSLATISFQPNFPSVCVCAPSLCR